MSWNRPQDKPKAEPKKPTAAKGIVAGCVFVVAAAAALWFIVGGDDSRSGNEEDKTPRKIKEVKPSITSNQTVAAEAPKKEAEKKPYQDQFGNWWIDKTHPYVDPKNPPRVIKFDRPQPIEEKLFQHTCDIRIAQLLQIEPGDDIEPQVFGPWFKKDFANSLVDKIEITDEDDEFSKNLKQAVIDTRKEIIQRVKNGEDVVDIMNQAWDEMYRLGQFKSELQTMIFNQADTTGGEMTDEEIGTYIDAANKMLEGKGLPPFKNRKFVERTMKLRSKRSAKK